ncbi:MAG: MnhB domain-containing protein [bacterium]|nr:MnhB domain-containing protein [bacterium]
MIEESETNIEKNETNLELSANSEAGYEWIYKGVCVIVCVIIVGVLLYTASYLPPFGSADNPVNNEVSRKYIEEGMYETGAVNIITAMILDYRAFDTFGEATVLFVSACVVFLLLKDEVLASRIKIRENLILQNVGKLLIPSILLFGIYVILNGHISPGGGFSGGAILGAALILYMNTFGLKRTRTFFNQKTYGIITTGALIFYTIAKSYSFITGANHIESVIPIGTPGNIISAGLILPLNICVGLIVGCTMYAFYALFRRGEI